ncbi:hypothetical protein FACS1894137_11860 [Spirochaetia bacterium]|nr:hypothetical protein FACS1894137_11860 [Spirochaetia bacterium]
MNIETEPPRVGNHSDALDLLDTLIDLVKNDRDKKDLQLWHALRELRDAIERGIV